MSERRRSRVPRAGSVYRVMGAETEYGIHAPGAPGANPTVLSARVVDAYARLGLGEVQRQAGEAGRPLRVGAAWDFSDESPLNDARGWIMPRAQAHPSQLTDEPAELDAAQVAMAHGRSELSYSESESSVQPLMNMVLSNGARLYVDHAHPEYSSPEVVSPRDAVLWDAAGDLVALRATAWLDEHDPGESIQLYKNNTDNKAVSYGSHENYLMPRELAFSHIVEGLTPFFVTRQVLCGAGRLGRGQDGRGEGYQISQRADFFEAEVGLETTIRRPIINTRDEPHAVAGKYRRLHVIIGDANLSQYANYLKFATTSLVLGLIEAQRAPEITVVDPVQELQQVSHDISLTHRLRLRDGRRLSALEIQYLYLDAAENYAAEQGLLQGQDECAETVFALKTWRETLNWLRDEDARADRRVEWRAKLALINSYRERRQLELSDPRLALLDLQWADIREDRGLYHRLLSHSRMDTLVTPEQIARAALHPPEDTRAYFRGQCLQRFPQEVVGASWDAVIFRLPGQFRSTRIATMEPLRGTRELTEQLFEQHPNAGDFLRALGEERVTDAHGPEVAG